MSKQAPQTAGKEDNRRAVEKARLLLELRRSGVTDQRILSVFEAVPREEFVLPVFRGRSYDNTALPIDHGQTISEPAVIAMMLAALDARANEKVLEIGTGSGYLTALLCRLCRRVYSIERKKLLLEDAQVRLRQLRCHNVTAVHGDGIKGWPNQAPFPRIIVSAAAEVVPENLVDQLAPGGVMVIPVGRTHDMQRLLKVTRQGDDIIEENLGDVRFVPLRPIRRSLKAKRDGGREEITADTPQWRSTNATDKPQSTTQLANDS